MECLEFNAVLIELACERPLDNAVRKLAFAHAAQCGQCAQKLAVQRELTARMLEFSGATDNLRVPASIREQLLAAVAELGSAQTAPGKPPSSAPVIHIDPVRTRWNRVSWPLAAAATVLIILMSTAVWRQNSRAPVQKDLAENPPTLPMSPLQREQPSPAAEPVESGRNDSNRRSRRGLRNRQIRREADQDEAASDFVPLTPAMDQKAIENGMIVRLEVSRSKLIAMGLPLHMDGERETINTEVVMGDNGVAYAIRVVP